MQLKFIYFGAVLVIFILKTARAKIPGCDFSETVNISSSQKLHNGSYIYQGLLVPLNLTGEYDFIQSEQGIREDVKSHVRGCVCKLKPCLWICCRFRHMQASGECTDGLMEELYKIKTYLNVTLRNGSVVGGTLPSDFIVLRDRIRPDEIWRSVYVKDAHEVQGDKGVPFPGYDCLHPNQFRSGNTKSLVVAIHTEPYYEGPGLWPPGTNKLAWISEVLLLLTIAVYLYVKKLRNLHGKCFLCYMITTFMAYLSLQGTFDISLELCAFNGYFGYYFLMVKFLWLVAIGHQMWKGFTSVNRAESQYSFQAYSIFAWGTAAGMTGLIFLIDQIWEGEPNKVEWIPGMGWDQCYLREGNLTEFAYFDAPILILNTLNTAFFIMMTISIVKVKLSLKHFSDQNETARNLSLRMETYKMFLRLFIVMEIQTSVFVISYILYWSYGFFWERLVIICGYCHLCTGIFIFVLFVLKPSTIRLLMESIRNREN